MNRSNPAQTTGTSATRALVDAARHRLLGRRGLFVLAGLVVAAGLAFGWSWLEAMGIASVLLATLPCIVMCALGLCMQGMGERSCSTSADTSRATDAANGGDIDAAGGNPAKPAQVKEHEHA
jgi:hypothetical protein